MKGFGLRLVTHTTTPSSVRKFDASIYCVPCLDTRTEGRVVLARKFSRLESVILGIRDCSDPAESEKYAGGVG